jgi:hypothetical protein
MSSINRIHNEYYDYDRYMGDPPDPPEAYQTVLDFFSAETEDECKRRLYKNTSCGAWINFKQDGIVIGSIVEGCDFGTITYPLHYADDFTSKDIQDRIDAVEREAAAIWEWQNVPFDRRGRRHRNGKTLADQGQDCPDIHREYSHFEQGERST